METGLETEMSAWRWLPPESVCWIRYLRQDAVRGWESDSSPLQPATLDPLRWCQGQGSVLRLLVARQQETVKATAPFGELGCVSRRLEQQETATDLQQTREREWEPCRPRVSLASEKPLHLLVLGN